MADVLSGDAVIKNGQIYLDGICFDITGQKISRQLLEEHGIFVVKNENRLIGNLNVSENMSILSKRRLIDLFRNPGSKGKLVDLTLAEFFPELNPGLDASELPLSVHWKIGILKAYIEGARLIVLDRVIEFCSDNERRDLFSFIKTLRKKGAAFIITYNKIAPFLGAFDRLGIVRNGELAGIIHQADYNPGMAANLVIGREYSDRFSITKEEASVGSRLFEVQDSGVEGGPEDISLILHSAEILGIYDPVQAKSTELIDILSGGSSSGKRRILVDGREVLISEEHHAVRAGIGIVSEKIFDRIFFSELAAGQNLAVSAAKRSAGFAGFIASSAEDYLESRYLTDIGFPESEASTPVKFIEKDLQFILALHMRILSGVKIFLLENPVRGADLLTRKMVYQRMESLRKAGTGVIFISTDYTELDGFCDRIIQYDKIGA